jgi:hypothetical protein
VDILTKLSDFDPTFMCKKCGACHMVDGVVQGMYLCVLFNGLSVECGRCGHVWITKCKDEPAANP